MCQDAMTRSLFLVSEKILAKSSRTCYILGEDRSPVRGNAGEINRFMYQMGKSDNTIDSLFAREVQRNILKGGDRS